MIDFFGFNFVGILILLCILIYLLFDFYATAPHIVTVGLSVECFKFTHTDEHESKLFGKYFYFFSQQFNIFSTYKISHQ
jgi:hypothetical protein